MAEYAGTARSGGPSLPTVPFSAMPCLSRVDPVLRLGMVRATGVVTGTDIASANEALYADPHWREGFDEFWDCGQIQEFIVGPEEMAAIAEMEIDESERIGPGRVALVMTREVVQLIGYLYRRLVEEAGRPVEVVGSLEEGARWLGLPGVPEWLAAPAEGGPAHGASDP